MNGKIALFCFLLFYSVFGDKLTFEIEHGYSVKGQLITVSISVLRGGALDIGLYIRSPTAGRVYSGTFYEMGEQVFSASDSGSFEICFDNENSRAGGGATKLINFELTARDSSDPSTNLEEYLKKEPSLEYVMNIEETLHEIVKMQQYLRLREQKHRDTAESTNSRIVWFTLLETILLTSFSLLQVFTLKKWFGGALSRK